MSSVIYLFVDLCLWNSEEDRPNDLQFRRALWVVEVHSDGTLQGIAEVTGANKITNGEILESKMYWMKKLWKILYKSRKKNTAKKVDQHKHTHTHRNKRRATGWNMMKRSGQSSKEGMEKWWWLWSSWMRFGDIVFNRIIKPEFKW